jgi:hypothetical protein
MSEIGSVILPFGRNRSTPVQKTVVHQLWCSFLEHHPADQSEHGKRCQANQDSTDSIKVNVVHAASALRLSSGPTNSSMPQT